MITEMTSISQCWSTSFTKNNAVSNITLTQHSCLDSYGKFSVSRELKTGQALNTQCKNPITLFFTTGNLRSSSIYENETKN